MLVIADLKSGFVSIEALWQMGAYSLCRLFNGTALPPLDGAVIVKCNDQGCAPLFYSKAQLTEAAEDFTAIKRLFDRLIAQGAIKNKDVYELFTDGELQTYPRVTAVIKGVINRPALNAWVTRQAVEFTLRQMIEHQRTPQQVLDMIKDGFFDPTQGSRSHMEKRGDEGRALHRCAEAYLKGQTVTVDPAQAWLTKAFTHFKQFCADYQVTLHGELAEQKVFNADVGIGGTLDWVVEMEETPHGLA